MAPKTLTGLMALSALSSAAVPNQRRAQTTQALLLPVEAPEDQTLWASVITADASSTEYLVACQTASATPDACDGPYTGVTLTQGPQTMDVSMGGRTYACDIREQDALCEITQQDDEEDTMETETIARHQWATVAVAVAEPTEIPYLEMRTPKGGGRGGSSSSSSRKGSGSGSGSGSWRKGGSTGNTGDEECDSDDSDDSDDEQCKKKNKDNAGAKVKRAGVGVAVAAMGFAALM
ncbi:uncharacterized protein J7T54_008552 [Emericellopsis cladophorae]|uniref:Uncharacterized protein n=1 Tax=Emericellopsis cladophorae TaxID=2686198 RepID=A0A9Q0B8C8_9HYPO|nr:uncharacterized protein J7T54_008552 [Emericellopsis cladophorae]KAI6777902.1 hypothetical protein J7T54_008552 [Emericellopsis cladophorae]